MWFRTQRHVLTALRVRHPRGDQLALCADLHLQLGHASTPKTAAHSQVALPIRGVKRVIDRHFARIAGIILGHTRECRSRSTAIDEQLSTRERLELFVAVCHGVQHAHQKGIIHRDLKPSNMLIEVHDVRPVPKVIDFGIAKAMGQQLTEQDAATRPSSQMVGTPLYMSPEQAGQSDVDVDTRSDIYSLGVLLYELLTGSTPFEKDALRTAGVDEMRRIIREVDPPRPSARVSTLQAADLSTISERRHVEPSKLSQQLRGELDWIVMKALDKDRDRRYATANDLAADVERYLHDEPVQACPPSTAYRFTKFARRNQAVLVTSALFALLLIAGTGVSVWQAIRATNAEVTAITERDEKDGESCNCRRVRAEQRTAQALLTAQERLQFGRQAVDEMYTQVAEKWLAQQAELTQVQKQFLEKALAFYQRLATEQSDDPAVLFETANAQQRVGEIQNKLGKHAEAEAAYRRAIELFVQLPRETQDPSKSDPGLAKTRRSLGCCCLKRVDSPTPNRNSHSQSDCVWPWSNSTPTTSSTSRTWPRVTVVWGSFGIGPG